MLRDLSTLVWIGVTIAVAAGPIPVLRTNCILPGSYCMDTVKPCCEPAVLQNGHVRHHEHICFIFGQGLCQPLLAIPRMKLYVSLVRKLNSTNYMELRRAYRQKVDNSTTTERTDSDFLLLIPSSMRPKAIVIPMKPITDETLKS
ncbi:cysteine motif protein 4 [Diadegma semiclausum ichnovirus]|nr:cysteine motif protein 4 [Diadegma semiclausum ichnovirus]